MTTAPPQISTKSYTNKAFRQFEKRVDDMRNGRFVDLSSFFGVQGKPAHVFYGDIVSIVAGSGYGKTAFMQNLVDHNGLPTLYISPEVSYWLFLRRQLQIKTGLSKNQVYSNYTRLIQENVEYLDNICVIERGINKKTIAAELKEVLEEIPVKQIVIDHMKLMAFDSKNIRSEIEEFVAFIKPFAVENEIIVYLISQVPKSAQGMDKFTGKQKKLELEDASEAGGIFEIADVGITINAPFGKNSGVRSVSIDKGRDLDASAYQDVLFQLDGNSFRFSRLTENDYTKLKEDSINAKASSVRNTLTPPNTSSNASTRTTGPIPSYQSHSRIATLPSDVDL